LRDKPKSGGRPTELPKERNCLKDKEEVIRKQTYGWNTKQVNDIIVNEGRVCSTIILSCMQTAPQVGF
jgi:hypothetical protein